MNKLHLRAFRRRAASAIHLHKSLGAIWRRMHAFEVATPLRHGTPLHAQWHRNAATGALECLWVTDAPAQPRPRVAGTRPASPFRMQWHARSAGMRPPSREHVHG
jgi:hypothetical protein